MEGWSKYLVMSNDSYASKMHIITGFTVFIQIYVLYLIAKMSPKEMSAYRYFLLTFCCWDLFFTLMFGGMLVPAGAGDQDFGSYMLGYARLLPDRGQIFATALTIYAGSLIIMSQDYCLLYRLLVILDRPNLLQIFLSKSGKITCIFVQQTIAISIGFLAYFSVATPEQFYAHILTKKLSTQIYFAKNGFFIWCDFHNSKFAFWFLVFILGGFIFAEVLAFVMVFCIVRLLKSKVQTFSKKTYSLHHRLMLLLAFQSTVPLVLIMIPIGFSILNVLYLGFNYDDWLPEFSCILLASYAIFNALLTITFINTYRRHLFGKFKLIKEMIVRFFWDNTDDRRLSMNAISPDFKGTSL